MLQKNGRLTVRTRKYPFTMQHAALSVKPFLKWAGGKRQLLPTLTEYAPKQFQHYYEPFVGAGALFLALQPRQAVINDLNAELVNAYRVIQKQPEELLRQLQAHSNDPDYFYQIRALDREAHLYEQLDPVQRASRTIYLNKTCYNGLYRVNRKGQFNAPFGRYRKPLIADETGIRNLHRFLNQRPVRILNTDFEQAVQNARAGDFVYFDPPYDPLSPSASFTAYQQEGFGRPEQRRLARVVQDLTRRGCRVMLSNSSTDFIRSLYKGYTQIPVSASRRINAVAANRGLIEELLVLNYHPETGKLLTF
ncbi:MAG: DNA adenine methylase [Candidatus Sericytochromatia bacterium]|nr:DNA adenine methylase [Candidatus Sericytochromatia bacterium]